MVPLWIRYCSSDYLTMRRELNGFPLLQAVNTTTRIERIHGLSRALQDIHVRLNQKVSIVIYLDMQMK